DEERPGGQVGGIADTATRPEWLVLDDVAEPDPEMLGITERGAYVVDAIGARQDDVGHAGRPQQSELGGGKRAVEGGDDRLRRRQGQGPKPRTLAAGENDRLQRIAAGHYRAGDQGSASLISITGMPSRIG